MKLTNIQHILAIAQAGSLRGGSRLLGITQPCLSRSVRDVENELGVSLFTRHGHGVSLTLMGQLFVQRGTAIEVELRRLNDELEHMRGHFTGQISIAMSSSANLSLMPKIVKDFADEYPEASLKLIENEFKPLEDEINSGEIDFFVGQYRESVAVSSLVVEKLFNNRRVVVGRKGHPLAQAKTLDDLRDARWIRPHFVNRQDEASFDAIFERVGLRPPEIVVEMRSAMMTLMAVAHTDMLTIVPVQWLDYAAVDGYIEGIDVVEALGESPVCIVRRGDVALTPLAERLYAMIRDAGWAYARELQERRGILQDDMDFSCAAE